MANAVTRQVQRILVVDDNRLLAQATALALELQGFDTRAAYDGLAALELAAQFRPHAVLIDLALPLLDGYEVAARLHVLPVFGAPRLVAWSGLSDRRHKAAAFAAGFDAFLLKPAAIEDIRSALLHLGRRRTSPMLQPG